MSAPSYVSGISQVPLLGETIGENLRRTVERVPDGEALVSVPQGYRATYREFWDETALIARGAHGARSEEGRPGRHLVAQPLRVGGHPVRHRRAWAPSWSTSTPPTDLHELEYALKQSGVSP